MIPGYREPAGAPPMPKRPSWWRVAWCRVSGLHAALEMGGWVEDNIDADCGPNDKTRYCYRCGAAFTPLGIWSI